MRKVIGILVCLFLSLRLSAVSYQPVTYSAPPTGFRSTSAYTGSMQPTGSLSAISSSNFEALNSEGGACYNPSASGPRKGRPNENTYGGTGAIGNVDFHSPVGEMPWAGMLILAVLYAIYVKKRKKA